MPLQAGTDPEFSRSLRQSQCQCLSQSNPSNWWLWWRPLGNPLHSRKNGQKTQFPIQYNGHHLLGSPMGLRCLPERKLIYESLRDRWHGNVCVWEGHINSGLDTTTCIKVSIFLFINRYSTHKIKDGMVIQLMACTWVNRKAHRIFGGENWMKGTAWETNKLKVTNLWTYRSKRC